MPSTAKARTMNGRSNRIAALLASLLIAAALVFAIGSKPASAGHKWIGPAIAGVVIGGIIAHGAHRQYHGKHYNHYPKRNVRSYRPHYPRRYYGTPYYYGPPHVAIRGPGFGLYIGR